MVATETSAWQRARVPVGVAMGVDVLVTLIFVLLGRSSHAEMLDVPGILQTWWPFLVGLAIGWFIARAWPRTRLPRGFAPVLLQGVIVWLSTLVIGMFLRLVAEQGTAIPFVIVATLTLGVLLVGWRAAAGLFPRR